MTIDELRCIFAKNVTLHSESRGWNQRALAKHSRMSTSYISEIAQCSANNPTFNTLIQLANAFEVEPCELLKAN